MTNVTKAEALKHWKIIHFQFHFPFFFMIVQFFQYSDCVALQSSVSEVFFLRIHPLFPLFESQVLGKQTVVVTLLL